MVLPMSSPNRSNDKILWKLVMLHPYGNQQIMQPRNISNKVCCVTQNPEENALENEYLTSSITRTVPAGHGGAEGRLQDDGAYLASLAPKAEETQIAFKAGAYLASLAPRSARREVSKRSDACSQPSHKLSAKFVERKLFHREVQKITCC